MFKELIFRLRKDKISYVFLAPFLLLFFVFTILPVGRAIFLSFTYYDILQPARIVGVSNYIRLFLQDDVFLIGVKNTIVFASITGPFSYILCFVLAWLINETGRVQRSVLTLFFYAPSISGMAFVVWAFIFSSDRYGLINSFLINFGISAEPVNWLQDPRYILWVVILAQLWLSLGTGFLAFIAGFQCIDRSLYEAGAVDGVKNRWQELWFITLPSMKEQLMFGAVMQITASFAVNEVSTTLAGNPSVDYSAHTVMTHLTDYGTTRFDLGYACAIATLLFLAMVIINKIVQKMLSKVGS